jgi:hypothetical protein
MEQWINQLSAIQDVVTAHEYWMGVLTSMGLAFFHHRIRLPKIMINGGGGGSSRIEKDEFFGYQCVYVFNSPHFLGYPIKREDLEAKSARLYDPTLRRYIGPPLRWRDETGDEVAETRIQAGQYRQLNILGIYNQRVHHYCGQSLHNIELSETLVELNQSRRLEVHIFDSIGRRYRVPIKVSSVERRDATLKVDVTLRAKTTITDRLREIRRGVQEIWSALTRPSY